MPWSTSCGSPFWRCGALPMLTRRFSPLDGSPAVVGFAQGVLSYRFSDLDGVLLEFQHLSPIRAVDVQLRTSKELRAWRGLACLPMQEVSACLTMTVRWCWLWWKMLPAWTEKGVILWHHNYSSISSAPDGVYPRGHTELCVNAHISRRTGIPLNHHLLSKSQELFRRKSFFQRG